MQAFATTEDVEGVLDGLADRPEPLVTRLDRQPGRKEVRYVDALVARDVPPPEARPAQSGDASNGADLAREVAELRADLAELRETVAALLDAARRAGAE
jgi:hypothetical protein